MSNSLVSICKQLSITACIFVLFALNGCKKDGDNAADFTFYPTAGAADSLVTITGKDFSSDLSVITVKFGTVPATDIVSATATEIKVKVPKAAVPGNVKIAVTVAGKERISADDFSVEGDTWKKSYGGGYTDQGSVICRTADGGYVMAGFSSSDNTGDVGPNRGNYDILVVRTDAYGNKIWAKTYGGSEADDPSVIIASADGGFIIAGSTYSNNTGDVGPSHGDLDIWLFKIDGNGKLLWQKTLGGSGYEWPTGIVTTPDGGYLLVSNTASSSGDVINAHGPGGMEVWVVKLDGAGNIKWQKAYGGIGFDWGNAIATTADGGFIVAGSTWNENSGDVGANHGREDAWVIKADVNGNLQWQKTYGGSQDESASGIITTSDGGYILTARTASNNDQQVGANHGSVDIWIVKITATGSMQWQKTLGGTMDDYPCGILNSTNGGYVVGATAPNTNSGDIGPGNGYSNIWLVKLSGSGTITGQQLIGSVDNNAFADDIIAGPAGYYVFAGSGETISHPFGPQHAEEEMWMVKTKEP